ncbi:MAG: hypothetical protein OJF49_002150 [Ktedonobacterales bacterium]|nr:MAG: hypothetical protein OJF49_002150 [Ktedonobacterales bacterium]
MQVSNRILLRLSLALFVVSSAVIFGVVSQGFTSAPHAFACCSGSFYGGDTTKVDNATQSIFPQLQGAYCGITDAMAVTNYADEDKGVSMVFTSQNQQKTVASDNKNVGAASQWGGEGNAYAGVTNISGDFGTDPRSEAYMSYHYTPIGYYYHNFIYRWQFVHSSAPSHSQQVLEATSLMGHQLVNWHEPLIVAVNEGLHFLLVTGVYSTNDPFTFFPAGITGLTYRDPQDATHHTVSISDWTNGISGGYDLWKYTYGNPNDPDPNIGPYTPGPGQEHWSGGFDWISRDANTTGNQWSPDWAFNAYNNAQLTTP